MRGALLVVAAAVLLSACVAPQPWQKDALALPEMTMGGDPLEQRFDEHIATSKQAASGGYGVGGGGCGCN